MDHEIERCIDHIGETNVIRQLLWRMDDGVEDLSFGVRQGDDCIVVDDLAMNMEGPYPIKIGRKTGLVHSCSDVVVMGAKPLFALNSMQVDTVDQAEEVAKDLKKQSQKLEVPMIGGNTQLENELNPCVSFTVVGRLVKEPIPDAALQEGDKIIMLGEIVEGSIGERCYRARMKFNTFLNLIEEDVEIHAAKDASRGGWFGNLIEMSVKGKKGVDVTSIPYRDLGRYMGNYLISLPENEIDTVVSKAAENNCPVVEVGEVTDERAIRIGDKTVVGDDKFIELIQDTPYRKPKK